MRAAGFASAELRVVIADLPFELVLDPIEGRLHVRTVGVGPEDLPGDRETGFDPLRAVETRVLLRDDLDLETGRTGLEPLDPAELAIDRHAMGVGEPESPTRELQVHHAPPAVPIGMDTVVTVIGSPERRLQRGWPIDEALVRLTWSLTPHPPAGGIGARRAPSPPSPERLAAARGRTYL
jgi:hypothetical protein